MTDQRLQKLENIEYQQPPVAWEERKGAIREKVHEIVEIFEKNSDDQEFLKSLKRIEKKLQ